MIIGAIIWDENMKVRIGFVTNSSSSSFIIAKKHLDADQIEAIKKHDKLGEKFGMPCTDWYWGIEENEDFISGYTSMNNFSMYNFLEGINVPERYVNWGEYKFDLNEGEEDFEISFEEEDWRNLLHSL